MQPKLSIGRSSWHELDGGTTRALANAGLRGPQQRLPHLDSIQAAFGRHDVSNVRAHTDAHAAEAAQSMGAEAYTTGDRVAFASATPDLHTAAHEAAHVLQQRAGLRSESKLGGR